MSYTSLSVGRPGSAWDGVEPGSAKWNELREKQLGIIAAAKGETVIAGWATGLGKFVNIITYPDVQASKKVIATLGMHQLFEIESSGPFIPTEEYMELASS